MSNPAAPQSLPERRVSVTSASPATVALQQLQQALDMLPGLVAGAVQDVLRSMPPQSGLACMVCFMEQARWEAAHMAELDAAAAEAEAHPGENPAAFLPAHLRPGGSDGPPRMFAAQVIVNGSGVCAQHLPGNPVLAAKGTPVGRKEFLVAQAPLSPQVIREAGAVPGVFTGLPGVPVPQG